MKFRKKRVVIDTIKWTCNNERATFNLIDSKKLESPTKPIEEKFYMN